MPEPKQENRNGEAVHFSVGAIIRSGDKYLLIDRAVEPLGFAGIAGHVDEGETPEQALQREIAEESGLKLLGHKLLIERVILGNRCRRGVNTHHWYVYACETGGEPVRAEREVKSMDWYSADQIKDLQLEPVWAEWFKELKII